MNFCHSSTDLSVVPIVFNAGAAVLPAILAGVVSVAAILFKPTQWRRVVREAPLASVAIVLAVIACGGLATWWLMAAQAGGAASPTARRTTPRSSLNSSTDWTAVALAYLSDRGHQTPPAATTQSATTSSATAATPFIFRGDANRSGALDDQSPINLRPTWGYIDPEDDFAQVLSSAAISGDRVFGTSCTINASTSSGSIFCLNARTGERRWLTYQTKTAAGKDRMLNGIFSSPAVTADGRMVIVGEGLHLDRDSALLCLDAATGEIRWQVQTPLHVEGSPAIEGDIVVVGAGAIENANHQVDPGDNPGFVMGVRISDGKELWRHPVNDPESSPVIADGIAYIGSGVNGSAVVALRIASDEDLAKAQLPREVWRTPTPYPAVGDLTLADNLVLIGCGKGDFVVAAADPEGVILALDRSNGKVVWSVDLPDVVLGPIAVKNGRAVAPVRNGEVVAIDLKAKGKILWRQRISDTSPVLAGVALTDRFVYAVANDGTLAVLNSIDGAVLEKHILNRPGRPGERGLSTSAPILRGGYLFVGSETGGLQAFTGKESE